MDLRNVMARHYRRNMRVLHGWLGVCAFTFVLAAPAIAAPQRIVSTFLCTDEYLFRLVPRDRIAALSFEAGDRNPVVSTIADKVSGIPGIHPTIETVLNFKPDLVLVYAGTNPRLAASLAELGVPVLNVSWANTLGDIRRITHQIGARLGEPARADALIAEMDRTLSRARAMAAKPPVRTVIYESNGYASEGSVPEELMNLAGLADAAPSIGLDRMGRLPVESVVASAPELLILSGRAEVRNARADLVLHHPALASIANRALVVWQSLRPLSCPGPWSAETALTFAKLGNRARALARTKLQN